jgi:glycosyltransferase involved in cell wall biosynthesis
MNTSPSAAPLFSVVIATRDRAVLFEQALQSVLAQTLQQVEVIVVNDGSSPQALPAYEEVLQRARATAGDRLKSFHLVRRPRGHGQSYSLNFGVDQAAGEYVAFLDDDDMWIDSGHLQRAADVLRAAAAQGRGADLYMGNQEAFVSERRLPGPIWLEALAGQLKARGRQAAADGTFDVEISDLIHSGGFCHLNCFIVRRELWQRIGGMDEGIRWECDRDVFLRLLDNAGRMLHQPAITSRHHVPDPKAGTSMTTSLNNIERRLWQVRVLDKAALTLKHPLLREHGNEHKGYALKRITEELASQGDWRRAGVYAGQALAVLPTLKWALYTLNCRVRGWLQPRSR